MLVYISAHIQGPIYLRQVVSMDRQTTEESFTIFVAEESKHPVLFTSFRRLGSHHQSLATRYTAVRTFDRSLLINVMLSTFATVLHLYVATMNDGHNA